MVTVLVLRTAAEKLEEWTNDWISQVTGHLAGAVRVPTGVLWCIGGYVQKSAKKMVSPRAWQIAGKMADLSDPVAGLRSRDPWLFDLTKSGNFWQPGVQAVAPGETVILHGSQS